MLTPGFNGACLCLSFLEQIWPCQGAGSLRGVEEASPKARCAPRTKDAAGNLLGRAHRDLGVCNAILPAASGVELCRQRTRTRGRANARLLAEMATPQDFASRIHRDAARLGPECELKILFQSRFFLGSFSADTFSEPAP